jgi:hypothetical protein
MKQTFELLAEQSEVFELTSIILDRWHFSYGHHRHKRVFACESNVEIGDIEYV